MTATTKDNFSKIILISFVFHILFILLLTISIKNKMVVIPNTLTVELSGFSAGKFSGLSELKQQRKGNESKNMTEQFFSDSRSSDSVREESQKEYFLPSKQTYDAIKKDNAAALEKMLQQAGDDDVGSSAHSPNTKSDSLLSDDDYQKGKDLSGTGKSPTSGKSGSPVGSLDGSNADVDSGLDLTGLGRGIVYPLPAKPEYPEWAKKDLIQGTVKLKLSFDKDGFVVGVAVIQSSGNTRLDIIAKNYAQQLRIQPGSEEIQESMFFMNFKL